MSGYNSANEPVLWWKVAHHLDEAQIALANALAHNVDDPGPIHALYNRLREGQAILLEIFRAKGLLPGSTNGVSGSSNGVHDPAVPTVGEGPAVPTIASDEPAVPEADHAAVAAAVVAPDSAPSPEVATVAASAVPEVATSAPLAPDPAPGAGG